MRIQDCTIYLTVTTKEDNMNELKFIEIDATVKQNIANHGFKPTRVAIPKAGEYYYNPNHNQPVCCKTNRNRGMLFIICEKTKPPVKPGQIYYCPSSRCNYIVGDLGYDKWVLINLETGCRYRKPTTDHNDLVPANGLYVNKKVTLV